VNFVFFVVYIHQAQDSSLTTNLPFVVYAFFAVNLLFSTPRFNQASQSSIPSPVVADTFITVSFG
jgi:hypothetical protein